MCRGAFHLLVGASFLLIASGCASDQDDPGPDLSSERDAQKRPGGFAARQAMLTSIAAGMREA